MIWLIGESGMLGKELGEVLTQKGMYWAGSSSEVDITDTRAIDSYITKIESSRYVDSHRKFSDPTERKVKWIINCAGYNDVDNSQTEEGALQAKAVNTNGVLNVARAARAHGAKLIHVSSDYVFDGEGNAPIKEADPRNPINEYGKSKSAGEDAITSSMSQYYIIRTSALFGVYGENFVTKVLAKVATKDELSLPNDQTMSPTSCVDLANILAMIIEKSTRATSIFGRNSALSFGVYHFANEGSVTWFDFAKKVVEEATKLNLIQSKCKLVGAKTVTLLSQNPQMAPRPLYTVLDSSKMVHEMRLKVPTWDIALHTYMTDKRFKMPAAS